MIDRETIFTGCDSKYWKKYGVSFVKSFKHYNPSKDVFVQIFNPDAEDIQTLKNLGCSYNAEYISELFINDLVDKNIHHFNNVSDEHRTRLKFGLKFPEKNFGITKLEDKMKHLITFATYASYRFIRLSELWTGNNPVCAYDIDTICRYQIDINAMLGTNSAGCLSVKGNRFVVSLVAFKNNSSMLKEWGESLQQKFDNGLVYGFLDQDMFVSLSEKHSVTPIDKIYCDHTSKSIHSYVMTGKGTTKFEGMFANELAKWQ